MNEIDKPVVTNEIMMDLVGLPYAASKEEAAASLVKNNPALGLQICPDNSSTVFCKSNPNCRLSVIDIVLCKSSASYRLRASVTLELYKLFGIRKLKIFSAILHTYVVPRIDMCYKCKSFGHYAKDCEDEEYCGKCSLNHRTDECTSANLCCINCKRQKNTVTNHDVFSKSCPVLREHINQSSINFKH